MSKIESALAKARARGTSPQRTLQRSSESMESRTDMVPMERRATLPKAETAASNKPLALLEEPMLLGLRALAERRIIHADMTEIEVMTAFRELRTKILQVAQRNCTILVTSCTPVGGGAGFVSLNLATAFSLDDSKSALLLDCHLVRPSLDHLFPSRDVYGLTDYLKNDDIAVEQIIHPVGVRRLRVVPTGRSHDRVAEYFTSAKMRRLMAELRERYRDRYIILNAPPIVQSADARILAEISDYVVMVVSYGKVTEAQIVEAAKAIGDKKFLGVVFNDMPNLPRDGWQWLQTIGWSHWPARVAGWLRRIVPNKDSR